MANFAYTAKTFDGREITGVLTAETEQAAASLLEEQRLFPVQVRPASGSLGGLSARGGRVPGRLLGVFYSQLADLLHAGVPLLRSLDVLTRQTHHRAFAGIVKEIHDDVAGGSSLADSMGKHPGAFSELQTSMVLAGERGGFLEDVLHRISLFTERQNDLRNRVAGSLIYPAFLLTVGLGIIVAVIVFFVPKFRAILPPEVPLPTRILFGFSDAIQENALLIFGIVGVAALGVVSLFSSDAGRLWWDRTKLMLPPIGKLYRLMAICRFCRILGTLLGNGVPVLQALQISKDSAGNRVLSAEIGRTADYVRDGAPLAKPLGESGLFPLDILDMIAVGEESNNLERVLVDIADKQELRVSRLVDLTVRMLEPMILFVMAGMVLGIALSLMLPIMQMTTGSIGP
jgi:general secretion pathway protein F/type IV pilus assembly protein PilC